MGADFEQRNGRQHGQAVDQGGLGGALARQHEAAAVAGGGEAHGQCAAYRPQLARERKFAGEFVAVEAIGLDLPRGDQDAQCDGQVEAAGFLGQVRRREIDGNASRREFEVAVLDGGADAVACFLDLGVGQADQGEGGQAGGEMDLDRDFRRRHACERTAPQHGERHGSITWRGVWFRVRLRAPRVRRSCAASRPAPHAARRIPRVSRD